MKKLLSVTLFICMTVSLLAQNTGKSYKGNLNLGGGKSLAVVLNFNKDDKGEMLCTMDSPDQGAFGIPAVIEHFSKTEVAVLVPAVKASIKGKIEDGKIIGKFNQMGFDFDIVMTPYIKEKISRPQHPKTPYPYQTEEVSFTNEEDHAVLCGTLVYPIDYQQDKHTPVIVMVTGSGQENRDEEVFNHKPFLVIADYLARHGIASLRYDDRGVDRSTGDVENATSENFMKDAMAGVRYLKTRKLFGKTGILGHSEGGIIAFMAAARYPEEIDFIVSLAGPGLRGDKILIEQNRLVLSEQHIPEKYCDEYCKALETIFAQIINNKRDIAVIDSFQLSWEAKDNLKKILNDKNPWFDYFVAYDPAEDIAHITCPVMAIGGSKDTQVVASANIEALRNSLPANERNFIKEYPGLNHLFQHCDTGTVAEYAKIEETISEEVLRDIVEWINKL